MREFAKQSVLPSRQSVLTAPCRLLASYSATYLLQFQSWPSDQQTRLKSVVLPSTNPNANQKEATFLKSQIFAMVVNKSLAFNETQRFITRFIRARHCSPSPLKRVSLRNLPSMLRSYLPGFSIKSFVYFSYFCACYIPHPSFLVWYCNFIW